MISCEVVQSMKTDKTLFAAVLATTLFTEAATLLLMEQKVVLLFTFMETKATTPSGERAEPQQMHTITSTSGAALATTKSTEAKTSKLNKSSTATKVTTWCMPETP